MDGKNVNNNNYIKYNPRIRSIKRNWIHRNPYIFSTVFTTTCLLIFFSRPIYDIFIRDDLLPSPKSPFVNKK